MSEVVVVVFLSLSLMLTYAIIRICAGAHDKMESLRDFHLERKLLMARTHLRNRRKTATRRTA
jgi:hypothetical protein